jgi:Tol biopolymer transport system component
VSWSPDGAQVALAASKGKRDGIFTARTDGTGIRFLRGTRWARDPVFSPDGSKIAFSRVEFGKNSSFGTTLWVADADGRNARRLVPLKAWTELVPSSFSPDGMTLAVTRQHLNDKTPDALLFDLERPSGRRVMARHASGSAFSPDGSLIAFARHSIVKQRSALARKVRVPVVHRDIKVLDLQDGKVRPLTRTPYIAESSPSWDPSGERIAFISFRISKDPLDAAFDALLPFGNSIVQVNADGSCRRRLIHSKDAALYGPAWQPGPGREAGRIEC